MNFICETYAHAGAYKDKIKHITLVKKAEKILINELSKKKFSIISEEAGKIIQENKNSFWIIDPIDGTTNFLHGIPHFCISLALISSNEIK